MLAESKIYTAKWGCYTVSTVTNLEGAGTYTNKNEEKVSAGEVVELVATSNLGYTWLGWYDGDAKVSDDTTYTFTMLAESKIYTAKWACYTISTETNIKGAGTYTSFSEKRVTLGETINLTATTNPGYTWLGWYDGDAKVSDDTTYTFIMSALSKIFTARWACYTVSTETNLEGAGSYTNFSEKKVTLGEAINLTATTNPGYTWLGWYVGDTKTSEGTSLTYSFIMSSESKTYTAKWSKVTIESSNNSAGTVSSLNDKTYVYGENVTITATTNPGYTWLGWYDGDTKVSEGTSLTYTFTMPAENKTYTAKWIECPVVLEKNIVEAGMVRYVEDTTIIGTETTIIATTNSGYTWLGWYDGDTKVSEGTSLTYTFIMSTESRTYIAQWAKVTLGVTPSRAGSVTSLTGTYSIGDEVAVTAVTKVGYTWTGWYDGDIKVSDDATYTFTMSEESKTYTAKWIECPVVLEKNIYEAGTVSGIERTTLGIATTIIATTNMGYTWLGWYDGDTKVSEDTSLTYTFTMSEEIKTYTAKWSKVTIESNDSSAGKVSSLSDKTYVDGEEVTIIATTNLGYIWLGWYDVDNKVSDSTSYTFVMSSENKTYTARWEKSEEIQNFEFTSTATTCTIIGIKDKATINIVVPDYVTEICEAAFNGCSAAESITIPFVGAEVEWQDTQSERELFGYIFGTTSYTGGTAVRQYYYEDNSTRPQSKNYYIPSSLRNVNVRGGTIPTNSLFGCSMLTSVTIGTRVKCIRNQAFQYCEGLTTITFEDTTYWYITQDVSDPYNTIIDVTDTSANVKYLTSKYIYYYWNKK